MPSRFDKYRVKDGQTKLGEAYFNPVMQDIDLRITTLESLQLSWEAAVQAVSDFGLVRINEVLGPVASDLEEASVAAEDKRQAALAAIEQLNAAIAAVPALAVNISAIGGRFDAIEGALPNKADTEDVAQALAHVDEALALKADQTNLDAAITRLPVFVRPDDLGRFVLDAGLSDGQLAAVDGFGLYGYHPDGTEIPDGEIVIAPAAGDGRWRLVTPHWDFVLASLSGLIDAMRLTAEARLGFPTIVAASSASLTITVSGASTTDHVVLTPPSLMPTGLVPAAFVSADNTVTVRLNNVTATSIALAEMTWRVTVIKP